MDKKRKIVTYASVGLVGVALATRAGISIVEKNVDHLNEYCPLNGLLGVNHQILKINEHRSEGYEAYPLDSDYYTIEVEPYITHDGNETHYSVPEGFTLQDGKDVKNIYVGDDAIAITKGKVVDVIVDDSIDKGYILSYEDIKEREIVRVLTKND